MLPPLPEGRVNEDKPAPPSAGFFMAGCCRRGTLCKPLVKNLRLKVSATDNDHAA
jgi:hypothetical protein